MALNSFAWAQQREGMQRRGMAIYGNARHGRRDELRRRVTAMRRRGTTEHRQSIDVNSIGWAWYGFVTARQSKEWRDVVKDNNNHFNPDNDDSCGGLLTGRPDA